MSPIEHIQAAAKRTAGAILPRLDFKKPVLEALQIDPSLRTIKKTAPAFRGVLEIIKGRHNSLVVADDNGRLEGLVTERDYLLKMPITKRKFEAGGSRSATIAEIMTPASALFPVPMTATALECMQTMRDQKVRHLPVMHPVIDKISGRQLPETEGDEVAAVVSTTDLARHIWEVIYKRDGIDEDVTVGDLCELIKAPPYRDTGWEKFSQALPLNASVADAVERMRETNFGAVLVSDGINSGSNSFGVFTERDLVYNVLPHDEMSPMDMKLSDYSRLVSEEIGYSKRTMESIASDPSTAFRAWRPDFVTCVLRETLVRDCLSLMLGNGLLYVPVIEKELPVDIITMRDVAMFLTRETEE